MSITQPIDTAQELAELQERFRALTTLAFDGIAIMEDGVFLEVNEKCAASLGYEDPEDLVGVRVQDVLTPASWEMVKNKFATGNDVPSEVVAVGRDGSQLPNITYGLNVPYRGRVVRMMAARGICDQVALERQVIEASNHEQTRIGRDLHDGLGQSLTGLALSIASLKRKMRVSGSPMAEEVAKIESALAEAVEECRHFAHLLTPVLHDIRGVGDALKGLARNVASLTGIECCHEGHSGDVKFDQMVANHLYRIAQESVNNAVKHANASRIDIVCAREEDRFYLTVTDNGRGIPAESERNGGIGIPTMHYRARMIEGTLDIGPQRSGGTRVVCSCPLQVA